MLTIVVWQIGAIGGVPDTRGTRQRVYTLLRNPHSQRHHEDERLLALVRLFWLERAGLQGLQDSS
jgi:uncharacterized protein (DUF433 family)